MRTAALVKGMAALLVVLNASGYAQDTPSPAPASAPPAAPDAPAAPAQTEMQKWIATTDEQWQAVLKRDVTDVHLTELEKLKQQYVAALEAAVTKASAAGDLDGVVVLRNEEKRFAGTNLFPEQDEATDGATVKQIRVAVRAQMAKLEKDAAARTKALHAKYDAVLADAQTRLTKAQRIEDALLVKAKREEVAKAWNLPASIAGAPTTPLPVTPPASTEPAVPPKVVTTKQPSAPKKEVAKDEIIKALVGTWHFHWTETGFDADFHFRADGKFIELPAGHKGAWTIADDKIVMEVMGAAEKIMNFPLDPAGTKVTDRRKNRNVVAVKKK